MEPLLILTIGVAFVLLCIFFYYVPFLMWISAKVSGVNISLIQLFLMRIQKSAARSYNPRNDRSP